MIPAAGEQPVQILQADNRAHPVRKTSPQGEAPAAPAANTSSGPATVTIADGAGYTSKSAGGTVYFGGYDPTENALYLGDGGHANGMAAAGGTPVPGATPGITVVETPPPQHNLWVGRSGGFFRKPCFWAIPSSSPGWA